MKKLISYILVLSMSLFMFSACNKEVVEEVKDTTFKVMSFNIRCLTDEEDSNNLWKNRKDDVAALCKKYDADLIGFQELKESQYSFMQEMLIDYGFYGVNRADKITGEYSAIFYKKSRFEVLEEGSFWMSETPEKMSIGWDASTYRITSYIKLKDKISGKELYHYNTHLDHQGTICTTESCKLLLEKIAPISIPVIMTGDFNLAEGSSDYNLLVEERLKDSKFLAPSEKSDTGGTTQSFGTKTTTLPIDFILFSPLLLKSNSYTIIRDKGKNNNYPSDHFPIISELDYN